MSSEKILETLEKWHTRIRASHKGHYKNAARLSAQQHNLGIVVVVFTAIVGTSVFASLAMDNSNVWLKTLAGIVSILTVVFAALQTFLNYPAKQVTHLLAATQLSSLKKRIEEQITVGGTEDELKLFMHDIRTEWDAITHGAPLMSEGVYNTSAASMVTASEFDFSSKAPDSGESSQ